MKLYKYMPYRSHYFLYPKLRLTQRAALNDVFECLPAESDYSRHPLCNNSPFGRLITQFETFDSIGIVSFGGNFNRPTMWSHYANQHRGIVVEFDSKLLGLKNTIAHSSNKNSRAISLPQKVKYHRDRQISPKNSPDNFLNTDELANMALIKHKDWKVENEIRIICRLDQATEVRIGEWAYRILCDNSMSPEFRFSEAPDGLIRVEPENERVKIENGIKMYNFSRSENATLNAIYTWMADFQSSIFLYHVPIRSISKVYLGAFILPQVKDEIICDLAMTRSEAPVIPLSIDDNRFDFVEGEDCRDSIGSIIDITRAKEYDQDRERLKRKK